MRNENIRFYFTVICITIIGISFIKMNRDNTKRIENLETILDSLIKKVDLLSEIKFTPKLLKQEILNQKIKFPDIVLKQACLETAHFTSVSFKKRNNLFGFHNGKDYLKFDTWKECVKYYKKWQDKLYKSGDYYVFLEKLPYAQDSTYIDVLKKIIVKI